MDYEFSHGLNNFCFVGQSCVPEVDAMETALNQFDLEKCIICEERKVSGIHICNQLICDSCQREMVETGVEQDRYQFFIQRLGKLSIRLINETEVSEGKCS